jgi:Cytochrome P450
MPGSLGPPAGPGAGAAQRHLPPPWCPAPRAVAARSPYRLHRVFLGKGADLLDNVSHGQVRYRLAVCQTLPGHGEWLAGGDFNLGVDQGCCRGTEAEQIRLAHGLAAIWRYAEALVADRAQELHDDFTSDLLLARDGDVPALTLPEVTTIVYGLLMAGHETTTCLLGNAFSQLLTHRHAWEAICQDPALIPNAIEEVLRLDSSVITWRRKTTQAVDIGGVSVPANANVLLLLEARYCSKRDTHWVGYTLHLTETCDPDHPDLITQVITTPATTLDGVMGPTIHHALAQRDLLPGTHLLDRGYVDADGLVTAQRHYQIDVIGPAFGS